MNVALLQPDQIMLIAAGGCEGGHLVGNYTEVGQLLRLLGWEIYSTYYVPNVTIMIIAAVSVVLFAIGAFGRSRAST